MSARPWWVRRVAFGFYVGEFDYCRAWGVSLIIGVRRFCWMLWSAQ